MHNLHNEVSVLLDREDLESSDDEVNRVVDFDESDGSDDRRPRILDDSDLDDAFGQDSVKGDDQFDDCVAEEFENLRKLANGTADDFNSVMVHESAR